MASVGAPALREQVPAEELEREIHRLRQANEALRRALARDWGQPRNRAPEGMSGEARRWALGPFVGQTAALNKVLGDIDRLQRAPSTPVLIQGESGTGKELVARAIHAGSGRAAGPFVPVNCAAIPRDLADSLLFGHVKGAFTGAERNQAGYFDLADGGTLFLDEVGTMPLELQARLLRVLEDRQVMPLGASAPRSVEVRVLAATNVPLRECVESGGFRPDLYYRLAVFTIQMPPLRQRREDVGLLARHFLQVCALDMGLSNPTISPAALSALEQHDFPGNVRELRNIIERAVIESQHGQVGPEHLHLPAAGTGQVAEPAVPCPDSLPAGLDRALAETELMLIQRALALTGDNVAAAARLLGTHRSRIYRALARKAPAV